MNWQPLVDPVSTDDWLNNIGGGIYWTALQAKDLSSQGH